MEFQKKHLVGVIFGALIIILDLIFFMGDKAFYFIFGIASIVIAAPFVLSMMLESSRDRENDEMFLEFTRDLVESVKSGTPLSRSIINVKEKNYGSLTPYIRKLANQIAIGITVKEALRIFANDTQSKTIARSMALISEAEQAGGSIENILISVAKSVGEGEKLKKERKAAVYSLAIQSYIIFIVFIVIMLIMQFRILTLTSGIVNYSELGTGVVKPVGTQVNQDFYQSFLWLLIFQGLFAGLITGKLAEGSLKAGVKHSFFLIVIAVLTATGAEVFFG